MHVNLQRLKPWHLCLLDHINIEGNESGISGDSLACVFLFYFIYFSFISNADWSRITSTKGSI